MKVKSHRFYLFALRSGKKKLAYGTTPEDALETLGYRLSDREMSNVVRDRYTEVKQTEIQRHVSELG